MGSKQQHQFYHRHLLLLLLPQKPDTSFLSFFFSSYFTRLFFTYTQRNKSNKQASRAVFAHLLFFLLPPLLPFFPFPKTNNSAYEWARQTAGTHVIIIIESSFISLHPIFEGTWAKGPNGKKKKKERGNRDSRLTRSSAAIHFLILGSASGGDTE